MKQEDKDLLIKDLSSRLPYGVILECAGLVGEELRTITKKGLINNDYDIDEVKPWLFPLSSMTEEQRKELQELYFDYIPDEIFNDTECVYHYDCTNLIDWLNKNHFDYRGLIPLGLAKDATGLGIYGK